MTERYPKIYLYKRIVQAKLFITKIHISALRADMIIEKLETIKANPKGVK